MPDAIIRKVSMRRAPQGTRGQYFLASGEHLAMRLWAEEPTSEAGPQIRRDYETVGFVIDGRAELHLDGEALLLEPGDSWVVPRGAAHTYHILETFTAVEATTPPAVREPGKERPPR